MINRCQRIVVVYIGKCIACNVKREIVVDHGNRDNLFLRLLCDEAIRIVELAYEKVVNQLIFGFTNKHLCGCLKTRINFDLRIINLNRLGVLGGTRNGERKAP